MTFPESPYLAPVAALLVILLLACGQQQRLTTHQEMPSVRYAISVHEGYEISFKNPANQAIIVWTNKDDPSEHYTVHSQTPLRINKTEDRLRLRYAYKSGEQLGPISPWVALTRVNPPPYPLAVCTRTTSGRMISWQANDGSDSYSTWWIRHGRRHHGPFSTARRTVTIPVQADMVWLQWVSHEVRGAFKAVTCQTAAEASH